MEVRVYGPEKEPTEEKRQVFLTLNIPISGERGRVKLYKSDYLNYVIDGSVDYVNDSMQGVSSLVKKLTVATQFSKGRGFYNRPALRIYATYAKSTEELDWSQRGTLPDSGFSCGIQFETWW